MSDSAPGALDAFDVQSTATVRRRILATVGAMLVVPLVVGALLVAWLGAADSGAVLLGALGWLVALAVRLPAAGSAGRLRDPGRARTLLAAVCGPTDEVVRLALVLIGAGGFTPALWAGFGWALAELAFTMSNGLAHAMRLGEAGSKGRRATELLLSQGGFGSTHPWHGVVERTAATAFHLGATLLLATQPWLVLLVAPAHAAVNLSYVRLARHRLARAELLSAVLGASLLLAGLVMSGRLL